MTLGRSGPYNGKSRTRRTGYKKVFGSEAEELGFRPINAPEPIQLMNDIAVLIARGYITSAVVNVRGQCRAKISLTSKEKIKVERSETRSYQLEE